MTIQPMRIAVRCWAGGELLWIDRVTITNDDEVPQLVEKHAHSLAHEQRPHMLEMEFLDEPDPLQRFFRFGTDPSAMVMPIEVVPFPEPPEDE